MVAITSLLVSALALASNTVAERLFHNSGTLQGWDYVRREHKGTVDSVTNVSYKSGTALKMTQTYDPSYHGRYHAEVDHNDGYSRGDERFYGFMFRVSDNWEFVSQNLNIAQFIAHRPGSDINCGDLDMPSTMLWIAGRQLHSRLVQGPYVGGDCRRNFVSLPNLGEVKPGKWHKVIIQAKWEDNGSGYFKLWFDNAKVVERYNLATTVSGDWRFQFRVGAYMNSWHDSGHMEGSQPFRQIWYDEVAVGTTYKDVDPDQN
ncbi:glucuronan lyase A [Beauveria brongniartii RCEF 3172]|uniref:Glucuronan lyase A n=1 Tax=Beauveria brongniartii RCEF 3172 TaxID=1081107 RepID=A0A166YDT3_9HYPO|nr:glucuronan lyase A [Beauveria brongniartii RCEF 3172]